MRRFAALMEALDATRSQRARQAALTAYFREALPADAAWGAYFLAGGKPSQLVPTKVLRATAQEAAGLPDWLFDECYEAVGDLAETIALVLPEAAGSDEAGLAQWMRERLLPLRGQSPAAQQAALLALWGSLPAWERFTVTKLITGNLRIGVSRLMLTRALAELAGVDAKLVAQRLVGYTARGGLPDADAFTALIAADTGDSGRGGQPYPFFLAHPLQADLTRFDEILGPVDNWLVEWKWDGIRAQLIRRQGQSWIWSRGEELISERFPELLALADALPEGSVLDGEIVVWKEGRVAPFALLQQRIGRKTLGAKLLAEAPAALIAYDLLEVGGEDLRQHPLGERRRALEALLAAHPLLPALQLSPRVEAANWTALAQLREDSRARSVEGLMLKALDSRYGVGRTKDQGTWWKWKIDPHTIDAVLLYAQPGHGKRAALYTDYTFAVWRAGEAGSRELVPFAKAYSGLTDAEIREVDAIIRKTTVEKFGPVRSLTPTQVFELGFEGIAASPRHKSGVAVRFPRILRWRHDKPVDEADTLDSLKALLPA